MLFGGAKSKFLHCLLLTSSNSRYGRLFYGGQVDLTRYNNNITALNVDLDTVGKPF